MSFKKSLPCLWLPWPILLRLNVNSIIRHIRLQHLIRCAPPLLILHSVSRSDCCSPKGLLTVPHVTACHTAAPVHKLPSLLICEYFCPRGGLIRWFLCTSRPHRTTRWDPILPLPLSQEFQQSSLQSAPNLLPEEQLKLHK